VVSGGAGGVGDTGSGNPGTANSLGGGGGAGGGFNGTGGVGGDPGGGGGAGGNNGSRGNGADGQIVLTYTPAANDFDAERAGIRSGLVSAQGEGAGWNAIVKNNIPVGNVVRTSATVVTITLPAFGSYNITANETIESTIPATALVTFSSALVATPTFNVTFDSSITAALTGTITNDAEVDIVAGVSSTIILTLNNDTWVASGSAFDAERAGIRSGLVSAQGEGAGWNAIVKDNIPVGNVVRTSPTVVTITLPAFGSYVITANETIEATIPASALVTSGSALVATPTFDIQEGVGINLHQMHYRWRNDDGTETTTVGGFPQVPDAITVTSFTSDATTHDVSMPATVDPGDLLLVLFASDGDKTVTDPDGAGPWTQIFTANEGANVRATVYGLVADGTEDDGGPWTVDFVTSGNERAMAHVYRITDWEGNISSVEAGTAVVGNASNPDPPAFNPAGWDVENTLWIAFASVSASNAATGYPTNYTDGASSNTGDTAGAHVTIASARRELAAASDDPGIFTMGSARFVVNTIAIRQGNISPATFAASEDTAIINVAKSTPIRLRFEVSNEGATSSGSILYQLESATSTSGSWTAVPDTASSENWETVVSAYITEGEATLDIPVGVETDLTNENTTFVAGELRDVASVTAGITLTSTEFTEIEYSIQATSNSTDGQVYYFRLTNAGADGFFTYPQYAQATLQDVAANLTGTVTDDVAADIVAGGSDIVLTLILDTWVAGGSVVETFTTSGTWTVPTGITSVKVEAWGGGGSGGGGGGGHRKYAGII